MHVVKAQELCESRGGCPGLPSQSVWPSGKALGW